jgi:23S rRNA pseudouridine2605 synthase
MSEPITERLHKRIAASGLCSRRAAESMIAEGRVTVNGKVIQEMGFKVGPEEEIRVDGKPIESPKLHYLAMNKPKGVVTTLRDPEGRPTVLDYLPRLSGQVKPIGRLDKDTEGLLLFTNDGRLIQRLTHPRFGIEKEYVVSVDGIVEEASFAKIVKGLWIPEGGKTSPATVSSIFRDESAGRTHFHITIHEGRKRQIRLMGEAIGHRVRALKRVRVGPVELKSLAKGVCRILGHDELEALFQLAGIGAPPKRAHPRRRPVSKDPVE